MLPARMELTQVPFYPQELYQCGPAALATVLNHHRRPVAPATLVPQVYIPERQGSLQIEMKVAARRYGLLAFEGPRSMEGLLTEIAVGRPVIVLQNLGFDIAPQWHYAVVVGYDLGQQILILRSGTERRLETPFGLFERTWARSGHWSLLALPPSLLPRETRPATVIRAALDIEPVDAVAARATLRAAAERWPDHFLVNMAAGNAELGAGRADSASARFRHALRLQPMAAEAWNNLAYSLEGEGCRDQARSAIACAVRLAPDNPDLRDSFRELSGTTTTDSGRCPPLPACPAQ
ncbi:PA2778 family cysteine peptidase [Marinobacterium aestuariivivens]|uniref:PA2778 family cysteine peptidase n=1 Tax=Marinobacterium aestuariivivens TaxID=1698799 RepID=A0ABW1ZYA2_9GAMM